MSATIHWVTSNLQKSGQSALHHWKNAYDSPTPPRGYLWIVHGLGEHQSRYNEFATYLNQLGFDVLGIDLPGHGLSLSEGNLRTLPSIDDALEEIKTAFAFFFLQSENSRMRRGCPWMLLGHSMGGLIALRWIIDPKRCPEGVDFAQRSIVSAPALRLKMAVPQWKLKAAEVLSSFAENFEMPNGIKAEMLSRDLAIQEDNRSDPLVHMQASPRCFLSTQEWGRKIFEHANDIDIPTCLLGGNQDPIIDFASVKELYEALNTHKRLIEIEGGLHESINEIDRLNVYEKLCGWLLKKA